MSTASVGTEHIALYFGVRNRIVLLTERDAERCDLVRFDKAKRATRRFQIRLWVAEALFVRFHRTVRAMPSYYAVLFEGQGDIVSEDLLLHSGMEA